MDWTAARQHVGVHWLSVLGFASLVAFAGAAPAQAQVGASPYGVYVEGGRSIGDSSTSAAALGFTWRFGQNYALWGGSISGYGDAFVSGWRARRWVGGDQVNYIQIGLMAVARYRFGEGQSPWFFDAGIGGSTLDKTYQTPERGFSTRFQFTPALSVGRNFGPADAHELSLRLAHYSNGGIRSPNPGENFLRLRYVCRF